MESRNAEEEDLLNEAWMVGWDGGAQRRGRIGRNQV